MIGRINIVQACYKNRRLVLPLSGHDHVPSRCAVRDLVQKFETTAMLIGELWVLSHVTVCVSPLPFTTTEFYIRHYSMNLKA